MNVKTGEKRKNKQSVVKENLAPQAVSQEMGIVMMDEGAPRIEQETHNANHVLHYIALISISIIEGIQRKTGNTSATRIHAHLSCLKEFIEPKDLELSNSVNHLLQQLDSHLPSSNEEWVRFIAINANQIDVLSGRYGGLKNGEIEKMKDLFTKKCMLRVWWWKSALKRLSKNARKFQACIKRSMEPKKQFHAVKNQGTVKADPKQTQYYFMSMFSNCLFNMQMKVNRQISYLSGKATYSNESRQQIIDFIYFIKHHFPVTDKTGEMLWASCDSITNYFGKFPKVDSEESKGVLKSMDDLCKAVGVTYSYKFEDLKV